MDIESSIKKPTSGAGLVVLAVVLLGLGATGIVLYAVGAPDQLAEGSALGGLRAGLIIVSALCVGVGLVFAVIAGLRHARHNRMDGS
jgi:hypothetical protein